MRRLPPRVYSQAVRHERVLQLPREFTDGSSRRYYVCLRNGCQLIYKAMELVEWGHAQVWG